jgi:seryl-tRNA synthetase
LIELDERRRAAIQKAEVALARRNAASKEIGAAKKNKDEAAAQALMAEVNELKSTIPALEAEDKKLSEELRVKLAEIPNLPGDDVPDGADETANVEHHHFGAKRNYAFTPKQHFELGEALGQMDFETAAKLSGARFVVLKSGLARMERAIGQYMVDLHTTEHGYTEIAPPLLVRDEVMFGTTQLPKFEKDQFSTTITDVDPISAKNTNILLKAGLQFLVDHDKELGEIEVGGEGLKKPTFKDLAPILSERIKKTADLYPEEYEHAIGAALRDQREAERKLWLIPTAEVPLTNLVRESILDEAALPLRYTACTPCFRAEAGAAGKDTHGMLRQHQFNKVELVSITTPEASKDEHERMLSCAEEVLRRLGLHYRVVTLCAGDMGFAAQKTYDIEVWLPGQGPIADFVSPLCGDSGAAHECATAPGPLVQVTPSTAPACVARAGRGRGDHQQEGGVPPCPTRCRATWAGSRQSSGSRDGKLVSLKHSAPPLPLAGGLGRALHGRDSLKAPPAARAVDLPQAGG